MTPLELYHQEKRSGRFDNKPTPEPPQDSAAPETRKEPVSVALPDPRLEQVETLKAIYRDVQELEGKLQTNRWITAVLVILWLIGVAWASYSLMNTPKEVVRVEVPKTRVVDKTKVKKVYIAQKNSKWRERLCYDYGDWIACLAYKKNLPARARVGRLDL